MRRLGIGTAPALIKVRPSRSRLGRRHLASRQECVPLDGDGVVAMRYLGRARAVAEVTLTTSRLTQFECVAKCCETSAHTCSDL